MAQTGPGLFETTTVANLHGVYRVRILAQRRTLRGRRFTRQQTPTGAVWRGGDDASRSAKDDPNMRRALVPLAGVPCVQQMDSGRVDRRSSRGIAALPGRLLPARKGSRNASEPTKRRRIVSTASEHT
jgi:hypothetical protein